MPILADALQDATVMTSRCWNIADCGRGRTPAGAGSSISCWARREGARASRDSGKPHNVRG